MLGNKISMPQILVVVSKSYSSKKSIYPNDLKYCVCSITALKFR